MIRPTTKQREANRISKCVGTKKKGVSYTNNHLISPVCTHNHLFRKNVVKVRLLSECQTGYNKTRINVQGIDPREYDNQIYV